MLPGKSYTPYRLPLSGSPKRAVPPADKITVLANLTTILLLVLAVVCIGKSDVYLVGKWSIPLGINLVLLGHLIMVH